MVVLLPVVMAMAAVSASFTSYPRPNGGLIRLTLLTHLSYLAFSLLHTLVDQGLTAASVKRRADRATRKPHVVIDGGPVAG